MIRVAISMGDPLGIGPEVVALALSSPAVRAAAAAAGVRRSRARSERAAAFAG